MIRARTNIPCYPERCIIIVEKRPYGLFRFLADVALTFLTGGFWLIWIFVREMRNR